MSKQIELPCNVGDTARLKIFGRTDTIRVDYICVMVSKKKTEFQIIGTTSENRRFECTDEDINKCVFFNS